MLNLGPWICDKCHKPIDKVEDGYVIWHDEIDEGIYDIRIIHQGRCDDTSYNLSLDLASFLGPDGLVSLLSYLSVGPIMGSNENAPSRPRVKDWDNFVDFVRRVQIPGYEQARQYYGRSEVRERFSDAHEYAPYVQDEIEELLKDMGG